jgi:signal transduction histidine kinase
LRYFILFVIFCLNSVAQPITNIETDNINITDFKMQYFIDTTDKLNIHDIQKQNFKNSKNRVTLGRDNVQNTWIRIVLFNNTKTAKKLFLHNSFGYISSFINFYEMENNIIKNSLKLDLISNEKPKGMYGTDAIFSFVVKPDSKKTIYIQNIVPVHQFFEFLIFDEYNSKSILSKKIMPVTFIVGALFAFCVYNLMLYFSSKYREYLYYFLYISTATIWLFFLYGVSSQYLNIYGDSLSLFNIATVLLPVFLSLFIKTVFETDKYYKIEDRFLNSIIVLLTINAFMMFFWYKLAFEFMPILYTYVIIVVMAIAISVYRKGNKVAKYLLIGNISLSITSITGLLFYEGLYPFSKILYYSTGIGIILEALILSYLLSYRIRLLQDNEKLLLQQSKEKDNLLFQQNKMASLGEMVGNISHQWRQPLARVSMIQNYLLSQFENRKDISTDIKEEIYNSQEVLQFMSKTIDSFQNFYIVDSKPNEKTVFKVSETIDKVLKILEDTIHLQLIELVINEEENCRIKGEHNAFSQIILAIIQNSTVFFKLRDIKNPKIMIEIKNINDNIELTIQDNAKGVLEKKLPYIFDYGYSSRDEQKGSTGIGLYISKLIIKDKFSGNITARNYKGGIEFKILLPLYNLDNSI